MSTRSVIGIPLDNGLRGRYCHSDGAPVRMVPTLQAIVRRDGITAACTMLTDAHHFWASISSEQEPTFPEAHRDDTFVPGYGWFFSPDGDGPDLPYIARGEAAENPDLEFWYVLNEDHVSVFDNRRGDLLHIGDVRYDQDIDVEALKVMECGADFDRCCHVVWYHFPDAPEQLHRLGVQTYVGLRPRGFGDIVAFQTASGEWVTANGGGSMRTARGDSYRALTPGAARYWWSYVKDAAGHGFDIRAARIIKAGYKLELPAKLVATLGEPELIVPRGTVLNSISGD